MMFGKEMKRTGIVLSALAWASVLYTPGIFYTPLGDLLAVNDQTYEPMLGRKIISVALSILLSATSFLVGLILFLIAGRTRISPGLLLLTVSPLFGAALTVLLALW